MPEPLTPRPPDDFSRQAKAVLLAAIEDPERVADEYVRLLALAGRDDHPDALMFGAVCAWASAIVAMEVGPGPGGVQVDLTTDIGSPTDPDRADAASLVAAVIAAVGNDDYAGACEAWHSAPADTATQAVVDLLGIAGAIGRSKIESA